MRAAARDIFKHFVVMNPTKLATTEPQRSTLYQDIEKKYEGFANHELISAYAFDRDWSSWEMHPKGDEVVILLSGRVTFVLEKDQATHTVELSGSGAYVIVPKGVWHTVKTSILSRLLFITPGEGTAHREDL